MKQFLFLMILSLGGAVYGQDFSNYERSQDDVTLLGMTQQIPPVLQIQSNSEILQSVWKTASEKACSEEMRKAFSQEARIKLERQLRSEDQIDDLAAVLNPFLFSLGKSHTEFLTTSSETYYLFKSYEAYIHPELRPAPRILNPGVQVGKDQNGYYAREVLTGFPADIAGLKKNDRILSLDGGSFSGTWGAGAKTSAVVVQRQKQKKAFTIEVQFLDWNEAFQEAAKKSVQVISDKNGKKIGYVHLWSGLHPDSAGFLAQAVAQFKKQGVFAIILDLRGGYGGAWWEHLDPFYPDTKTYMQLEVMTSEGETDIVKSPYKRNPNYFSGPMAVLINEGVRSGKEALAHQFKKTKRAYLIGEKTPGYFSTGKYFYVDEPLNYALYLCVYQLKLDGKVLEGIGVEPDQMVPYLPTGPFQDSQIEAAVNYLSK